MLGEVHGGLGLALEHVGVDRAVGRVDRDTDVGSDAEAGIGDEEGSLDRGGDPLGDDGGPVDGAVREPDRELVASDAGHDIAGPDQGREAAGDLDEDLVADLVSILVVDFLEDREVETDQAERSTGDVGIRHRGVQGGPTARPVEQARQSIGRLVERNLGSIPGAFLREIALGLFSQPVADDLTRDHERREETGHDRQDT